MINTAETGYRLKRSRCDHSARHLAQYGWRYTRLHGQSQRPAVRIGASVRRAQVRRRTEALPRDEQAEGPAIMFCHRLSRPLKPGEARCGRFAQAVLSRSGVDMRAAIAGYVSPRSLHRPSHRGRSNGVLDAPTSSPAVPAGHDWGVDAVQSHGDASGLFRVWSSA